MSAFEFATAARVVFGPGTLAQAPAALTGLGASRVLLVTGRSPERAAPTREALARAGLAVASLAVSGEPDLELARQGAALARAERCDAVLALGGGSALDAGKAVAALATNPGDVLDYLEVIGKGRPLAQAPLPLVAVPTTAGTGSEVTRNAVLASHQERVKASLRSPLMLPRLALVDPELLQGLPPAVVAASGLDALSQLIEPYLSARANPLTDGLAREGLRRSARSLRRAVLEGAGPAEREDLALASLLGGLCLANAGLGAVHGFAAPAGGLLEAPHGALCAALLPSALEVNLRALRERAPAHPAVPRFAELAELLTGRPGASAEEGIAWVRQLVRDLAIPGLRQHGLTASQLPDLVARARVASSMKANPIALTDAELTELVERAM